MDIGTVVKALRNGGCVRRLPWRTYDAKIQMLDGPSGTIFWVQRAKDDPTDEMVAVWIPTINDILADDWELTL
jgi:hypothetical protein